MFNVLENIVLINVTDLSLRFNFLFIGWLKIRTCLLKVENIQLQVFHGEIYILKLLNHFLNKLMIMLTLIVKITFSGISKLYVVINGYSTRNQFSLFK